MLFHAFRVVYTVKEFDSHAKHGQSLKKKIWMYNRVFRCQKSHFRVRTSGEFFQSWFLLNEGGTPYMGISPGRTRPCTHRANQHASSGSAARHSLEKNLSKEECFGCEGKITLFSFPKQPSVT